MDDTRVEHSPYAPRSLEELGEAAAAVDCDLLVGDEKMLLVDLDTKDAVDRFWRMLEEIENEGHTQLAIQSVKVEPSRNGRWHGIVKTGLALSFAERVALQAILGSDPLREWISLAEYRLRSVEGAFGGGEPANCLFRPRPGPGPIQEASGE